MASPTLYRKRLINAINAPGHHIVYIFGPAGFGKSTLAKAWMESQNLPTAWVEGYSTSNARELFEIFLKKICEKVPHLTSKLKKLIDVRDVQLEHIEQFAKILEEDKTPFNIVIDNAEDIRRTHNQLSLAIVRMMPKHIKLILVTTTSPRADFVRDAGIKRFAVVNPDELRFNEEEIKQLASDAIPEISDKEVKEILDYTEGWPASAGIVCSLLKVEPSLLNHLTGLRIKGRQQFSHEVSRVLSKLEFKQRDAIRKLSLLRSITPDLAFAVTQDLDVIRQLTLLSQDSIVVTQISQLPPVFKIHPIFREELLDELRRDKEFTEILEVVVQFLLTRNEIRQATSILIEVGETLRLAELLKDPEFVKAVGSSIQDSIARSAVGELRDWIPVTPHLPNVGALGRSIINFYINLLTANLKGAELEIGILEGTLDSIPDKAAESWKRDVCALKSIISYAYGRFEDNWKYAIQAYQNVSGNEIEEARHQITYLQFALWAAVITENDERVRKISEILDDLGGIDQPPHRSTTIIAMRSLIAAHQGRLIEAQNHLITPYSAVTHAPLFGYFAPYGNKLTESILESEAGRLENSISVLQVSSQEALSSENYPMAIALLGRLSYFYRLTRKTDEALACIKQSRELIRSNALSIELESVVDIWEIRLRHMMHDNDRVQELLSRCRPSYFVDSFKAAASISTGNFDLTRKLIETFDLKIPRQAITYYLFRAYLLKDSPSAQLKEIAKAIDIGAKHGYFFHFVAQRADILQQFISLASEFPTAFNERLAQAAGEELNKLMIDKNELGDALTRREADILRHLATGLPLKEIARNLSISKNTIKTHLRNLYRKLGAVDRNDAVEKGKKLLKV